MDKLEAKVRIFEAISKNSKDFSLRNCECISYNTNKVFEELIKGIKEE